MSETVDEAAREVRDRVALSRAWLQACLTPAGATVGESIGRQIAGRMGFLPAPEDALALGLMRAWIEETALVPLDELGRKAPGGWAPVAWLSVEAVRAVYLVRELKRRGVGL